MASRNGLTPKVIINKRGHKQTVYVRTESPMASGAATAPVPSATEAPIAEIAEFPIRPFSVPAKTTFDLKTVTKGGPGYAWEVTVLRGGKESTHRMETGPKSTGLYMDGELVIPEDEFSLVGMSPSNRKFSVASALRMYLNKLA